MIPAARRVNERLRGMQSEPRGWPQLGAFTGPPCTRHGCRLVSREGVPIAPFRWVAAGGQSTDFCSQLRPRATRRGRIRMSILPRLLAGATCLVTPASLFSARGGVPCGVASPAEPPRLLGTRPGTIATSDTLQPKSLYTSSEEHSGWLTCTVFHGSPTAMRQSLVHVIALVLLLLAALECAVVVIGCYQHGVVNQPSPVEREQSRERAREIAPTLPPRPGD